MDRIRKHLHKSRVSKVLRITVAVQLLVALSATMARGSEPVGMFVAEVPGCTVTSGPASHRCQRNGLLFAGDVIRHDGPAQKLPIQWLAEDAISFEKLKTGDRVVFTPPHAQSRTAMDTMLHFFRARSLVTRAGVTRGGFEPGPVTVLSNRPVELFWCAPWATDLTITANSGREILHRKLSGQTSRVLPPSELHLARDNGYSWQVAGVADFPAQPIIVLTEEEERRIAENLALASAGQPPQLAALRRAVYLSYLNGLDPQRFCFDWLIYRELLPLLDELKGDDLTLARYLIKRSGYDGCK